MSTPHPPRLLVRLLERGLPQSDRAAALLGDLHEEFAGRAATSLWRARLWYAREAVGVALRYAGRSRRADRRRSSLTAGRAGGWRGSADMLLLNARYAIRRLIRSPLFTVIAILSLGIGIGANTAMFSLVNAVIIRDQPFTDPETLVDVYEAGEGFSHGTLSYPDYLDLRDGSRDAFVDVGGSQFAFVQVDAEEGVEMLPAEAVTGNYFSLLGVQPALGRLLSEGDHVAPGAHPVVVLGHGYWVRRFARDPDVFGRELRLAGRPYTVIGVAPETFTGTIRGFVPDVFVPVMMYDELLGNAASILDARGNQSMFAKARLAPGATLAEAVAVADRLSTSLREQYPRDWPDSKAFVLVSTADVIVNPMIDRFLVPAAGMVMVVVGLVLLMACANLASFLLARAADRRKEIAVRLALGAGRGTLIGQLLTETVLLAVLGGLAGVALAVQALSWLAAADLPLPLPITLDLSLDGTVLGFSVLVSVAAGVLFGLAPALQSTSPDVAPTLRDESAGGGRKRGALLRDLLVVSQVTVSVVLLVAAGLLLRSLEASRRIDPGFGEAPAGILQINMPADRYSEDEGRIYMQTLAERIVGLSGVVAVGFIDNLHLNQLSTRIARVHVEGAEPPVGQDFHSIDYGTVDGGFLEAAGIGLVAGRGFDVTDDASRQRVALVNEEMVRRFFPAGQAIGRTILVNDAETVVVGVTADHKVRRLGEDPRPYIYLGHGQSYAQSVTLVARTTGDADRLALDMLAAARALDPEVMVVESKTMERHLATMLLARELGALMVAGLALIALTLASIGIYGVVSHAVARRAKEVGIRLSLGADADSVVRLLTGDGMKLVAIGGSLGLGVSAALAQLLTRLLYGVPPLDGPTFLGVPLVLAAVALAACWIPARRVTRIDPVQALRAE